MEFEDFPSESTAYLAEMQVKQKKIDRLERKVNRLRAKEVARRAESEQEMNALRTVVEHRDDQLEQLRKEIDTDNNKTIRLAKKLERKVSKLQAKVVARRAESVHDIDELRKRVEQRDDQLKQLRKLIAKDKKGRNKLAKKLLREEDQLRQRRLKSTRYKELKLIVTCPVCFNARCSMAFQCGHLSCSDCTNYLPHCHICRQPILQRTRIFL